MKKGLIISLIVLVILVLVVWFVLKDSPNLSECDELANNFDSVDLSGFQGIVGGTLITIAGPTFEENYNLNSYLFSFHGKTKDYNIYVLQSNSSNPLNYETGNFYKFDLSNKRVSGYLSGSFIDNNSTLFIPVDC
jgi:hypothetical protein